jgi:hypothetical protein
LKRKTGIRFLGAAVVAAAITPWLGGAASADVAVSGDPRATAHDGNAVTCAGAGLAGTDITSSVTLSDDGTYVDITAVPTGKTVTGVVVKGGDAYNVYLPGAFSSLPWLDLHAPLNPNGQPAGLSHYYICAIDTAETTTSSAPVTTSSSAPVTTSSSAAASSSSSAAASVLPSKATSSAAEETDVAVEGTKSGGELAATGGSLPLGTALAISLGLLLAGAGLMVLPRRFALARGAHRRRH